MTLRAFAVATALLVGLPARAEEPSAASAAAPDLKPAPAAAPAPPAVVADPAPAAAFEEKDDAPFFPIWGEKARAAGFTLPAAFGLMFNYYYQQSDIEITDLKLGLNGPAETPVDFIKFGTSTATAEALCVRPNLMIFPFLTVYGVFSTGESSTIVPITDPVAFDSSVQSGASVVALGATLQMGWKGFFGVADFNASVSDVDRIADLVGANLLSFRAGYNHPFGPPGRSVAFWLGTTGQVIDVATRGSVALAEALPPPTQERVDQVQARCDAMGPLNPARQLCNDLASTLQDWVNGTPPDTTVSYALDKKPKDVWNMVAGFQFAPDRHWHYRVEAGFLGTRTTWLLAVEYRFDGP